jgi:hypothetical protein
VSRYRDPAAIRLTLSHYERFPQFAQMASLLSRRVGYFSWPGLRRVLEAALPRARKATKTGVTHEVPVHRVLAKVLAAWRLTG